MEPLVCACSVSGFWRSEGAQAAQKLLNASAYPVCICVVAGHVNRLLRGSREVMMSLSVMMTDPSSIFFIPTRVSLHQNPMDCMALTTCSYMAIACV